MQSGFLDRLVARLDRLDPESLQTHFLHLAQERGLLETIFQSIQEGVMVIDGEGKLTYANRSAEQMMGFDAEQTRGRPVSRYLREIDWDRLLNLDEGEWSRVINREIEITYPEHRFISFYVAPLNADQAGERGVLVILRDVTHEREQEATLLESERLNAVKLLAAGVAHEIGNPLNALNIHLQLLDREIAHVENVEQRGELSELLSVARNEVSRLDMIITQFLRAIRPSKPTLAKTQLTEVLAETLSLMKSEIENRSIDVSIEQPESVPAVRVDRHQIKQAFFNVMRNGLQAMSDGGRLQICFVHDDHYLSIAFRDNGEGIRTEDLNRIFEPYHTTKEQGTGLGLMIVQRIMQDHGGQIEIASKPDEGTCFTMVFPRAERRVRLLDAEPTVKSEAVIDVEETNDE